MRGENGGSSNNEWESNFHITRLEEGGNWGTSSKNFDIIARCSKNQYVNFNRQTQIESKKNRLKISRKSTDKLQI